MKILAVGAHPDDIELGCGGALSAYAQAGHEVHLLVVTRGECGGAPEVREAEQRAAAEVLGATAVHFGPCKDTEVTCNRETIGAIEAVVRLVKPDLGLVHYPEDTHQDHRSVARAFIPASRSLVRDVLYYESISSFDFHPTVYVDITATLETKLEAIRAHTSQVSKTYQADQTLLDLTRPTAAFRGMQARVAAAEAFVPARLVLPTS
jgi:LmbE family N-acetylglucosaminyl deacetylase